MAFVYNHGLRRGGGGGVGIHNVILPIDFYVAKLFSKCSFLSGFVHFWLPDQDHVAI